MTDLPQTPGYGGDTTNRFLGAADNAIQARDIGGGIHFHASAEQRVLELTAELEATRQALAQAHQEIQRLRSHRAAAAALGRVGNPSFRRVKRGYSVSDFDSLMAKLQNSLKEGPQAVLELLAFPKLESSYLSNKYRYDVQDVESYFAKVRQAMADASRPGVY